MKFLWFYYTWCGALRQGKKTAISQAAIRNPLRYLLDSVKFHFFLLRPSCFYGKIYFVLITNDAAVAELVDALDSKSSGE